MEEISVCDQEETEVENVLSFPMHFNHTFP